MLKPAKYIVLFACGLLLMAMMTICSSCTKELKLPSSGQKKKIVLLGELVAGDSITIRGAQSLTLSTTDSRFELPSGLSVTVNEGSNTIPLSGNEDDLSRYIFSIPFKSPQMAFSGRSYMVTATHADMATATAEVKMPNPFAANIHDTGTVTYNSAPAFRISVDIEDKGDETNYYVIEAIKQPLEISYEFLPDTPFGIIKADTTYTTNFVRQTIYSNDAASESLIAGTASRLNRRILFTDRTFNGRTFRTDVYIPIVVYPDSFMYTPSVNRTIVSVKSVSEEYYNFLKSYEQYEPVSGFNTNGAPIRIDGNVQKGLGMVGGVYRRQFYFWIANY